MLGDFSFSILCSYFQKVVNDAYKVLMPKDTKVPPEQNFCSLLNISACQFTEVNKEASSFDCKIVYLNKMIQPLCKTIAEVQAIFR